MSDKRTLVIELAHRSKNLLAIVQSLANQTAVHSRSIEEFQRHFLGRLQTLARIHDVLSDEAWRGTTMKQLIRSVVLPMAAAERIRYHGEENLLTPNAAQYVGLALHELAVISAERGALAARDGTIEISWTRSQLPGCARSEELALIWQENGGECIARAPAGDFGRVVLEEVVPSAVGGRAILRFDEQGMRYSLSIPDTEVGRFAAPEVH